MKRIKILDEYCMNCRLCEVHCLVAHSSSKKIIKAFTSKSPLAQVFGLVLYPLVAQRLELRLQRVDFCNQRPCRLDFAVVRRAEDLFGESSDTQHVRSKSPVHGLV